MSVKHKTKISPIKPNQGLWNKDLSYYKEYLDYVDKFNKAIVGRDKAQDTGANDSSGDNAVNG